MSGESESATGGSVNQDATITNTQRNAKASSPNFMPNVISFPALPSRENTTSWISPLPDLNEHDVDSEVGCLYAQGIDAHTGASIALTENSGAATTPKLELNANPFDNGVDPLDPPPDEELPEPAVMSGQGEDKGKVSVKTTIVEPEKSRGVHFFPQPQYHRTGETFRLGSALGASSHSRRKSSLQARTVRMDQANIDAHEKRKTWKKPRKDSGWPGWRPITPADSPERKESWEAETSANGIRRHSTGMSADGSEEYTGTWPKRRSVVIAEKAPALVAVDHAGIYSSMTGGGRSVDQVCDDGHVCGESVNATRSSSLVDWIG